LEVGEMASSRPTYAEALRYCESILVRNCFSDNDIDYYLGLTKRQPHGLPNSMWKKAAKNVGFNHRNLVKRGNKYCLGKLNARAKKYE